MRRYLSAAWAAIAGLCVAGGAHDVLAQASPAAAQVPTNNVFCVVGDSRLAHGFTATPPAFYNYAPQDWIGELSGQRVLFPLSMQFAVSGYTTTQVVANELQPSLSAACGNILFLAGINDPAPPATTIANYKQMFSAWVAAGKHVWVIAETPRGNSAFPAQRVTGNNLLQLTYLREWLLRSNAMYGPLVHVIDVYPAIYDPTNDATGDILTTMTYDGLHENLTGAFAMAQVAVPMINRVFDPPPALSLTKASAYNATYNPYGFLNGSASPDGSGGAITAPGTGTVAQSWTIILSPGLVGATGVTATASVVTSSPISGPGQWQQITLTGTTKASTNPFIYVAVPTASVTGKYTAGDKVYGSCQVEFDSTTGVFQAALLLDHKADGTDVYYDGLSSSFLTQFPAGPLSLTLRTPYFTATGTETGTSVRAMVRLLDNAPTNFNVTVRFRSCGIQKTPTF
jgi:hypothetical protein